jgi:(E)-4-hydroxy-3-methylbut-2-enyl-diphosphate synthase
LKTLGLRERGATLVACPTCGRVEVDLFRLANEIDEYLRTVKEPIKVAVMGCVVNGPGEARDSDVGVAAGRGKGVIFRKGKIVRRVEEHEIVPALKEEIEAILAERRSGSAQARREISIPIIAD